MRNIILLLVLICLTTVQAKAQQNDILPVKPGYPGEPNTSLVQDKTFLISNNPANENGPTKDHDYYNRKSRNQRIIGLSLLGGGLLLGGAAILVADNNSSNYQDNGHTAVAMFIISAAAGFASIPFMILAHSSKVKARAAVSTQKTFIPGKPGNYTTGITLSIPIGR